MSGSEPDTGGEQSVLVRHQTANLKDTFVQIVAFRAACPARQYQIGRLDRGSYNICLTEGFAQSKTKILEISGL